VLFHRIFLIIYSGLGKVNASIATFKAIHSFKPNLIINFGTVGKVNPTLSGLVPIGSVIQRDMMAEPLAPRGCVPFSKRPNQLFSSAEGIVCGTGDSFVTVRDEWLIKNKIDVVDMELFSIAMVAFEHQIEWLSYKYISDSADSSAGEEWSKKSQYGPKSIY
jgi:adenosylhomocysteine nucleosidase